MKCKFAKPIFSFHGNFHFTGVKGKLEFLPSDTTGPSSSTPAGVTGFQSRSSLGHGNMLQIYLMTPATSCGFVSTNKPLTPASIIEPPSMMSGEFSSMDIPKLQHMRDYLGKQLDIVIMSALPL